MLERTKLWRSRVMQHDTDKQQTAGQCHVATQIVLGGGRCLQGLRAGSVW